MDLADAKVAQVLVPVEDFEQGVAFYRDVLGLRLLFTAPPQMAFFDCAGVRLLVGVVPPGQEARRGSAVYFRVTDIAAVAATLRERGVAFTADPFVVHRTDTSEVWLAEFRDPDGNALALMGEVARGT